uniref:Uncharacterized protein n=1 Tax=Oryza glumipatula TaxID=40148 RepID=A0A0E0BM42_9ORYZ
MKKIRYIPFSMKRTSEPSQTVLQPLMLLMMVLTMDLHKLFFGPLTDDETLMLMKALHKLFFGPSRIDDDASFDGS